MKRCSILLFTLLLSGMNACAAQEVGKPYSEKTVSASALCRYAPCTSQKTRQVGDKFTPASEQFTLHEWKLNVPVQTLKDTVLSIRTTPRNRVDVTKLQFTLPKSSTLLPAKDLVSKWLNLLKLPPAIAAECLDNLGRVRFLKVKGLPSSLSGSCIAEEYQSGQIEVTFTISLKVF